MTFLLDREAILACKEQGAKANRMEICKGCGVPFETQYSNAGYMGQQVRFHAVAICPDCGQGEARYVV